MVRRLHVGMESQREACGLITGHVDDVLFAGAESGKERQAILQKIKERFKWEDWERDDFIQCGVRIQQNGQGFQLSQSRYVEEIPEIPLCSSRRKARQQPTTAWEKTKLLCSGRFPGTPDRSPPTWRPKWAYSYPR